MIINTLQRAAINKIHTFKNAILTPQQNFSLSFVRARKKSCCREPKSGPRIIVPGNCREVPPVLGRISCRVALVIGGSKNGFGYSAAEQFLAYGARKVILADVDKATGVFATNRLCKKYGKDRALFYQCDPKNSCHVESIFKTSICRDEEVTILFNDLDAIHRLPDSLLNFCPNFKNVSNVKRLTRLGLENLASKSQGKNGLIINCSTILGFLNWPGTPKPIYCYPEFSIETTIKLAKEFPAEQTGLRLVALCPTNRTYESIGLPSNDDSKKFKVIHKPSCGSTICQPDPNKDKVRLGKALAHVMGRAENGSCWLIEAPYTLRELPRLVHIPPDASQENQNLNKEVQVICYDRFDRV